jgi:hypothetical protein
LDEKLRLHAGHTPMAFSEPSCLSSSAQTETTTPMLKEELAPAVPSTTRPPLQPSEHSNTYFSFTAEPKEQHELIPEAAVVCDDETETENEDPELKRPLMLDSNNKSNSSNEFLDRVDAKLMEAAILIGRKDSVLSSSDTEEAVGNVDDGSRTQQQNSEAKKEETGSLEAEKDYEMPKLRMKNSTNFGSAFGLKMPGSQW